MSQTLDFIGEENPALKMILENNVQENDVLELIQISESQEVANVNESLCSIQEK